MPSRAAPTATTYQLDWAQFSDQFSGEWEGVTATFDAQGQAQQLDEHYVPQAFRDWGVELFDWQTTTSSLSQPSQPGRISLVCRRSMPTVGCEADAIAFKEEATIGGGTGPNPGASPSATVAAFAPDGSYVITPPDMGPSDSRASVEACLAVSPQSDAPGRDAGRGRVRVVWRLQRHWQTRAWQLQALEVHHERWDAPHRGGIELCGCGGGMPTFAVTPRLDTAAIPHCGPPSGWQHQRAFQPGAAGEGAVAAPPGAMDELASGLLREAALVCLPLGLWVRTGLQGGDSGDLALELGAAGRGGEASAQLVQVLYAGGKLAGATLGSTA